ncbi:MAG: Fic family protein, partial [Rhizobiaceae bacterium]|nr:Fic family protein [Rhizobiaceae bacterium]
REILPRFSHRRQDNAQTLVRNLYARPIIDVKAAANMLNTTVNTASSLISDLVEFGVLAEITGQRRNRLFLFNDYIELFRR